MVDQESLVSVMETRHFVLKVCIFLFSLLFFYLIELYYCVIVSGFLMDYFLKYFYLSIIIIISLLEFA